MIREKLKRYADQDADENLLAWPLPCDVLMTKDAIVTTVKEGCELRTLIAALKAREEPQHDDKVHPGYRRVAQRPR